VDNLAADFAQVPYARYAPVRRQLLLILRAVNDKRGQLGFELVPRSALLLRRRVVSPFAVPDTSGLLVPAATGDWCLTEKSG
jgi:hypothetical protein